MNRSARKLCFWLTIVQRHVDCAIVITMFMHVSVLEIPCVFYRTCVTQTIRKRPFYATLCNMDKQKTSNCNIDMNNISLLQKCYTTNLSKYFILLRKVNIIYRNSFIILLTRWIRFEYYKCTYVICNRDLIRVTSTKCCNHLFLTTNHFSLIE